MALHHSLRTVDVPCTAFDRGTLRSPLPPIENIVRVSGRKSDQVNFLVSGLTTFNRLDAIARHYTGVGIAELDVVVDWGVGCGRVVRHLLERLQPAAARSQTIIGVDIDEVNVKWCQENLSNLSPGVQFNVLSLDGFQLPSDSVDLLYGISIFTHLSEYDQHKWLSEIRRVLKPGAIAILTVNGEAKFCRQRDEIGLPFVQKFGFFDGVPDSAIGADRSDYYRSTLHTRPYILKNWGLYFEILDFIVMANAFQQDFVVVRRPSSSES
jgi:SAM-dependent methyltransferase